jgi:hypothetical protein
LSAVREEEQWSAFVASRFVNEFDPTNPRAALVSAYLVWEFMRLDELDHEIASMQALIDREVEIAAAGVMIDRLTLRAAEYAEPRSVSQVLEVLEKSILARPNWVRNHFALSIGAQKIRSPRVG